MARPTPIAPITPTLPAIEPGDVGGAHVIEVLHRAHAEHRHVRVQAVDHLAHGPAIAAGGPSVWTSSVACGDACWSRGTYSISSGSMPMNAFLLSAATPTISTIMPSR